MESQESKEKSEFSKLPQLQRSSTRDWAHDLQLSGAGVGEEDSKSCFPQLLESQFTRSFPKASGVAKEQQDTVLLL